MQAVFQCHLLIVCQYVVGLSQVADTSTTSRDSSSFHFSASHDHIAQVFYYIYLYINSAVILTDTLHPGTGICVGRARGN